MKKNLMILVFLVFLSGIMIYPLGTAQILTPKEGQIFNPGNIVNITFTSSIPNAEYDLSILLSDGGSPKAVLLKKGTIPGTEGIAQYQIPSQGGIGKYIVQVRTHSGLRDFVTFWVKEKPGSQSTRIFTGNIRVLSQANNALFKAGKPLRIAWDKSFGKYPSVKITLINAVNKKSVMSKKIRNTGNFIWTLTGRLIRLRSQYFIKITSIDNKFIGNSGKFRLIK